MTKLKNTTETPMTADPLLATVPCPNCKETEKECGCIRNKCNQCGKPVGNITFTVCDECWDIIFPKKAQWRIELDKVSQCNQRQDSLCDQIKDLRIIANKFGFYDAADFLKGHCC